MAFLAAALLIAYGVLGEIAFGIDGSEFVYVGLLILVIDIGIKALSKEK